MSAEGNSPPAASSSQTVKQRTPRRPERSCDFCRQRKTRCDGLTGPNGVVTAQCSQCLEFGVPCTYTVNPTRQRGPTSKLVADLRREIAELKARLRSLSVCSQCTQPLPQQDVTRPLRDTAKGGKAITREDDELVESFHRISIEGIQGKVFGPASTYALLSSALKKEKYLGRPLKVSRRQVYWEPLPWDQELYEKQPHFVYPASDLIDSLLELYFTNVHPIFPVLHRPSFERDVAEGLYFTDIKFGATLLAVLAVASRYSDDPRVFIDGETALSSGYKFIAQVNIFVQCLCLELAIYDVQLCFLLAVYSLGTSAPQAAWYHMGVGIRSLQHWCSHDRKRTDDKFDEELWNRVFWCFFALDRMVAAFVGRPPAIHTDDYDIDPLLEVDDECWERGFTQPLERPSLLSYFACFLRLCEILGDTLHRLYASKRLKTRMGWIGTDWEQDTVAELDSAMNDFFDSIPAHLRRDPNGQGVFLDQSTTLHVMYYYIQIMIHRPYIQKQSPLAGPSLAICTRAARSALSVASIWMNRQHRSPLPWLQNFVFVSAVVLLLNTFGSKGAGHPVDADNAQVTTALKFLKFAELRTHRAGRLWDLIHELQSLDGPAARDEVNPGAGGWSGFVDPSLFAANLPPADVSGFVDAQRRESFEPGVSIEQLLAETDPAWDHSPFLDNETMSTWIAAPTNLMNTNQWDMYIENMNGNGGDAGWSDAGAGASYSDPCDDLGVP
ncbi:fungal-specific transcription factor domain-containing protein [Mycena maculata]|uniref:Fungal-specific transcription factor domain-containing protein n=1 Tax=Mycena maculata TaxID=230809 RepID=A0AAD7N1T2_9AGAR|nr:fungal-specific transcription factor domain-containing protein [Mycena maculata]